MSTFDLYTIMFSAVQENSVCLEMLSRRGRKLRGLVDLVELAHACSMKLPSYARLGARGPLHALHAQHAQHALYGRQVRNTVR